jgi:uncharacterized protein with HEPN domain
MLIEVKSWLFDILTSINEIETFLIEVEEFSVYQNDLKTKRAVERNLEIIGEAMTRIIRKDSSIQFSHARQIIDTRNRIIHGYDKVSDEILWNIVTVHLVQLKKEIESKLS